MSEQSTETAVATPRFSVVIPTHVSFPPTVIEQENKGVAEARIVAAAVAHGELLLSARWPQGLRRRLLRYRGTRP